MRLEQDKRNEFFDGDCGESLETTSLEGLQENLHQLAHEFQIRHSFMEKLNPSLEHLTSFTAAISSASQYNPVACLVWGGIQAVVIVRNLFCRKLEDTDSSRAHAESHTCRTRSSTCLLS